MVLGKKSILKTKQKQSMIKAGKRQKKYQCKKICQNKEALFQYVYYYTNIFVMSIQASTASRFSIINWINDTLLLPLTKIEELGAGNVYCQLLDAAYPERVPLQKVKWDAKLQVDFLHNFKVLVTSFQYLGIEKKIDIQKLSKAKYQDNLQFIQWLKAHVEDKIDYAAYQPLKRRNYAKIYLGFANKTKFNVTLNPNNKQNLDNSFMKSSIKSNATMKSSTMLTSRSTASILAMSTVSNNNKNILEKGEKDGTKVEKTSTLAKVAERRKNVGSNKNMNKNQSCANVLHSTLVNNVDVIESQGQCDEFF